MLLIPLWIAQVRSVVAPASGESGFRKHDTTAEERQVEFLDGLSHQRAVNGFFWKADGDDTLKGKREAADQAL